MMNKIYRMTEKDLHTLIEGIVGRVLDDKEQLKLAQRELHRAGDLLSSVGHRLEGSEYEDLFRKIWDNTKQLNKLLIDELRNKKETL